MAAPVADQRILRGVSATLSWQNLDGDGEAVAPAGAVTVGVVNSAGTTVVAAGSATAGSGSDPRTYALSAANNQNLDLLTVTWTDAGDSSTHTTLVEVVGAFYFSIAEARASDPALANDTKYPTAVLIEARRAVEEEFEWICDRAFVPRFRVDRVNSNGLSWVQLKPDIRAIRSVSSYTADTATAWTAPELAAIEYDDGRLYSRAGKTFGCGPVVVAYEYGWSRPSAELKRRALQRCLFFASEALTGIPARSTTFTVTDSGASFGLARPGPFMTGDDDIDATLAHLSLRVPGAA